MSEIATAGTILAALVGAVSVYFVARLQSRSSPYEAMVTRMAAMETRLDTLEEELRTERAHSRQQDARIETLRSRVNTWQAWWRDELVARWSTHRKSETAPPAPFDDNEEPS